MLKFIGLAFNQKTYQCDWPDQVEDCDPAAFLGFTCPPQTNGIRTLGFRYYPKENDCGRYFMCYKGLPRLLACTGGTAFNPDISACDSTKIPKCL